MRVWDPWGPTEKPQGWSGPQGSSMVIRDFRVSWDVGFSVPKTRQSQANRTSWSPWQLSSCWGSQELGLRVEGEGREGQGVKAGGCLGLHFSSPYPPSLSFKSPPWKEVPLKDCLLGQVKGRVEVP